MLSSDAGDLLQEQRPLVFLHIPKTAGTSLDRLLERQYRADEVCPAYYHLELFDVPNGDLARYALFRGHFYYHVAVGRLGQRPRYITFLRDPIERALSHYAELQKHADRYPHMLGIGLDLEDFVYHPQLTTHIANVQCRYLAAKTDSQTSQEIEEVWWDASDVVMGKWPNAEEARAVLDRMTVVGLTERFDDSLALLTYTLGWLPIPRSEKLNATSARLTRADVPNHVLERLVELNQEDLNLYRYAQELFEARYRQMMVEQLKQHFQASTSFTLVSRLSLTMDEPLVSDSSWYEPESQPGIGVWRWTGPDLEARLYLPLSSAGDLCIHFGVAGAISSDVLAGLRVTVNGYSIPLSSWEAEPVGMEYEGVIPQAALGGPQRIAVLSFAVDRTISPHELDPRSADTRKLGIGLSWIEVSPAV